MEPHKLAEYAKVRSFDMPQCYHARDAVVASRLDPVTERITVYLECALACSASKGIGFEGAYPCSFLSKPSYSVRNSTNALTSNLEVFLDHFLSDDSQADFCIYNIRSSLGMCRI